MLALSLIAPASTHADDATVRAQQQEDGVEAYVWGPWDPAAGDASLDALIHLVSQAEQTIDVATYGCDLPALETALEDASRRAVSIRFVVDSKNCSAWQSSWPGRPGPITTHSGMHSKYVLIDGDTVWTGSANLTEKSFAGNAENAVVIRSAQVANAYSQVFEALFSGSAVVPSDETEFDVAGIRVEVFFGKHHQSESRIKEALDSATASIHVGMYTLTNNELVAALIAAHQREAVDVQLVLDDGGACNRGSDLNELLGEGVRVREDDFDGLLHHKFAVLDADHYKPGIITGSANWSGNGMHKNHENVLRIWDQEIAATYLAGWQELESRSRAASPCAAPASPIYLPWLHR